MCKITEISAKEISDFMYEIFDDLSDELQIKHRSKIMYFSSLLFHPISPDIIIGSTIGSDSTDQSS